jgi:hypothetical protein
MLATICPVVRIALVMRQISVGDQMHGRLGHLGHSRGDGEQQRENDQEPHVRRQLLCGFRGGNATPRMRSVRRHNNLRWIVKHSGVAPGVERSRR